MTVSEIMMRRFSAVAAVTEDDGLATVAERLALHGLGAVLVLGAAGALAGIITDGDVVKVLATRRAMFDRLQAHDIMSREVFTCRSDETELEVLKVMTEKQIRHMAVMMGESVVGLLTLEEAVKYRLERISQVTAAAVAQPGSAGRQALLDSHVADNWSIFSLFRAVNAVQEETGLAGLDARSRSILWLIGEAEATGEPLQLKDLMTGHKWGSYPTVRRHLAELEAGELIVHAEPAAAHGGRGKRLLLSPRGRDAFDRMGRAVSASLSAPDA